MRVVFTGSRRVIFVSLSHITRMQLYVLDFGIGPIMSHEIVCQGCGGISCGWSGAHHFVLSGLLLWHFLHPCMYMVMSFCMSGHIYCHSMDSWVFSIPRCPASGELWSSSRILCTSMGGTQILLLYSYNSFLFFFHWRG